MGSSSSGPILVVDDDDADRAVTIELLRRAGLLVSEASSSADVRELARVQEASLVVLEVCLNGLSGYELCRQLREEYGEHLPILFVSGERTSELDREAGLLVGADAYLAKPLTLDSLLPPVRRLLARVSGARAPELTKREHEVLSLLAAGLSRSEVAARLVLSRRTVGKHIEHILAKLGVHSESQAVAAAFRDGLVPLNAATGAEPAPTVRRKAVRRSDRLPSQR